MISCADLKISGYRYSNKNTHFKRFVVREWFRVHGSKCLFCGVGMTNKIHHKRREVKSMATMDHIEPLCLGGTDDPENLQVICKTCNNKKSQLENEVFLNDNL